MLRADERTVEVAVTSRFQNSGQSCIAAKRFIVVPQIAEEFLRRLKLKVEALKVGDPSDGATRVGPMARADLRDIRGNAGDGIHAASAGGTWQTVVFGFAGLAGSSIMISSTILAARASPSVLLASIFRKISAAAPGSQ